MEVMHEGQRFYVKTDGGEAELLYRIENGTMPIYYTFVPESERGKGIAEMLALAAFDFAKEKKLRVVPDCPYVVIFLKKHKELQVYSV